MHSLHDDILKTLLSAGSDPQETATRLAALLSQPLDGLLLDHDRERRCGFPEVIYGQGKTAEQIAAAATAILGRSGRVLATRVEAGVGSELALRLGLDYDPLSRCLLRPPAEVKASRIAVVCAGTSDLPVAREAWLSLRYFGFEADLICDIGVAGLHRLTSALPRLQQAELLIVCAGMEGALPSVLGGLVACPLVAVPTSTGYGAGGGGWAALLAMLNSCASGISVVNIDNGFGAACAAARMMKLKAAATEAAEPRMDTNGHEYLEEQRSERRF
ncbi:MAG: hypothetical protein RL095_896 [Verrucomicrobiota bacterium]|jgi:NCAIR mutase (PurE)-related protein